MRWAAQANYMLFDGYATVFSSWVFGKLLPEAVYKRHATAYTTATNGTEHHCVGTQFFALSHAVVGSLCLCSAAAAAVLAYRVVPTYRIFWAIGRRERRTHSSKPQQAVLLRDAT